MAGIHPGAEQQMLCIGRGKMLVLALSKLMRTYVMENRVIQLEGNSRNHMRAEDLRKSYLGM